MKNRKNRESSLGQTVCVFRCERTKIEKNTEQVDLKVIKSLGCRVMDTKLSLPGAVLRQSYEMFLSRLENGKIIVN